MGKSLKLQKYLQQAEIFKGKLVQIGNRIGILYHIGRISWWALPPVDITTQIPKDPIFVATLVGPDRASYNCIIAPGIEIREITFEQLLTAEKIEVRNWAKENLQRDYDENLY